jgi:hypothetical protein
MEMGVSDDDERRAVASRLVEAVPVSPDPRVPGRRGSGACQGPDPGVASAGVWG